LESPKVDVQEEQVLSLLGKRLAMPLFRCCKEQRLSWVSPSSLIPAYFGSQGRRRRKKKSLLPCLGLSIFLASVDGAGRSSGSSALSSVWHSGIGEELGESP
jgi:hypothetical protein